MGTQPFRDVYNALKKAKDAGEELDGDKLMTVCKSQYKHQYWTEDDSYAEDI